MMKMKILILSLALVLILVVAGLALANGGVELSRWTLGGGASDSTAGDITLQATLGQPIVGVVSNGDVTLGQGFWHGQDKFEIYLPTILK
jgi:hypothetical protein